MKRRELRDARQAGPRVRRSRRDDDRVVLSLEGDRERIVPLREGPREQDPLLVGRPLGVELGIGEAVADVGQRDPARTP